MRSRKHKRDGVMSHRRRHREASVYSTMRHRHNRTKKQTKEPHIPKPDPRIKPGDDFYKHINASWLRHIHMPAYLSSYGVSEEIEATIEKELETLETEKATIVEQLSSGKLTIKEVYDLGIKLGKISEEIESKTERWMELAEFVS